MPRREQPLGSGDDVLLRFARDLRALREKAGGPTYRQLSGRAHYSAATLSEAASGRKLPSLAVTLAYVAACGGDTGEWEGRWRNVAAELTVVNPKEYEDDQAPYVGLAAFQVSDADWFFGRNGLVDDLLARVRAHRFLGVFGASGSGKSSVLRAGLVARHIHESGRAIVFTPGSRPLEECAVRLAGVTGISPVTLRAELEADPKSLHLRIRQAETDLLLVVDQFEEVFTLCQDPAERAWLIDALTTAAFAPRSRCRVVLGVRADFYGHCGEHPLLVDALRDAQVLVGPMTADELRQAITGPAERAGCRVETALVARLVADAAGQPAVLPLVSHALLETWRQRRGTTLTLTGYEAIGGIQHAIARTAEEVYTGLDSGQQPVAHQIFLRLIALGDATEDTKRRVRRAELDDDPNTTVVLEKLARARLVTLDHDGVELAHEALIRHWPRLRDWLTEDRHGQRIHRELTEATDIWESHDRDPEALYRGTRLARAESWATTRSPALTGRERDFLHTSLATRAREQLTTQRRVRRLRRLVALLAVLVLLATAATVFAVRSQQTATQQRTAALAQKALREATAIRATNPALALQLALAAHRLDPTIATRSGLHEMFATPYASRLTGFQTTVSGVAVSPDGKTLVTTTTISTGEPVRTWDISDPHHPRELPGIPVTATAVAYRPDGRILATAGNGTLTQLWDITNPSGPTLIRAVDMRALGPIQTVSLAFSPNGRLLAFGSDDRPTELWNVSDPSNPVRLAIIDGPERSGWTPDPFPLVAFHPDGNILAVASAPDRLSTRLWNIMSPAHPEPLATLSGNVGRIRGIAFNPRAQVLATTADDSIIRLWDITNPRSPALLAALTGHSAAVHDVTFSRDGRTLATASADRTARLWDVSVPGKPTELAVLTGHADAVVALAFAADGRTLITGAKDRTTRLEDISQVVLASHGEAVFTTKFSPDSRILATAGDDGSARLWDIADQNQPKNLSILRPSQEIPGRISTVAFAPSGKVIATTDAHGHGQLWNITDPRQPQTITDLRNDQLRPLLTLEFSSNGSIIAAVPAPPELHVFDMRAVRVSRAAGRILETAHAIALSADGRMVGTTTVGGPSHLWDITDPNKPQHLSVLLAETQVVAFSPDGRALATVGRHDGALRLWDVTDRQHVSELAMIPGGIRPNNIIGNGPVAAFSSDGRSLVTIGDDRLARLWDITDYRHPQEETTLRGHTANLLAVAFSPDGRMIATTSEDHTIRLWDTDVERIAARICAVAHPRITEPEWAQYFPGLDFQPPCQ